MKLFTKALGLCFVLASLASASTINVTFDGTSGSNNGSVFTGPYNLTLDGNATLATCISPLNEITVGETWDATIDSPTQYTSLTGDTLEQLQEAQWLNQRFGVSSDWNGISQAIWDIFGASYTDSDTESWLTLAAANYTSVGVNSFNVLVPVDGTQSSGGTPQTFLLNGPLGNTPEPVTLMLLGSGLVFIGAFKRRHQRQQ